MYKYFVFLILFSDSNENHLTKYKSEKENGTPNINGTTSLDSDVSLLATYKKTLTGFGVIRIQDGRIIEKILWVAAITIIIFFTSYTIYKNSVRYLAHGEKEDIKTVEKEVKALPVISFCLTSTFLGNLYCHENESIHSMFFL